MKSLSDVMRMFNITAEDVEKAEDIEYEIEYDIDLKHFSTEKESKVQ